MSYQNKRKNDNSFDCGQEVVDETILWKPILEFMLVLFLAFMIPICLVGFMNGYTKVDSLKNNQAPFRLKVLYSCTPDTFGERINLPYYYACRLGAFMAKPLKDEGL